MTNICYKILAISLALFVILLSDYAIIKLIYIKDSDEKHNF